MKFQYPVYDPVGDRFGVHRDYHWLCEFTTDLDTVLAQPFRIASVPAFFNHPTHWPGNQLEPIIVDLTVFDLVLIHEAENRPWADLQHWIESTGVENYLLVVNNHDPDRKLAPHQEFFKPHWLIRTADMNQGIPVNQLGNKPYVFEAMMGARRPHRDYIMLAMTRSGLLEHSVVNYRGFPGGYTNFHTAEFQDIFWDTELQFPYISPNYDASWEPVSDIKSNTINFPAPLGVYQRTHYSIVPETTFTSNGFFPSEKTAKVLLAQRLAVWFAPENFLQNLRNMGFETFGDVIDESYDQDSYHRDWKRFERAWHTVEHMARFEDPVLLYQKLRPRLEHNRNHMLTLEQRTLSAWQQRMQELIPAEHWSA